MRLELIANAIFPQEENLRWVLEYFISHFLTLQVFPLFLSFFFFKDAQRSRYVEKSVLVCSWVGSTWGGAGLWHLHAGSAVSTSCHHHGSGLHRDCSRPLAWLRTTSFHGCTHVSSVPFSLCDLHAAVSGHLVSLVRPCLICNCVYATGDILTYWRVICLWSL